MAIIDPNPPKCPDCEKMMTAYTPASRLKSSEFYCETCCKSYPMTEQGQAEFFHSLRTGTT